MQWAATNNVAITARSGGHSYAGYSTVQNGLVVDLSSLDRVTVASGSRTALIGPGARLIEVYAGLAARGLAIPGGTCPSVGFGGLALGGGYGFASRALGMTCDVIESMKVVTANGNLVTADADTNSDLYWALRGGGGGNFGIVTRFTVNATRQSSAAFYSASWPSSAAEDAIAAWQGFAPGAPEALTATMGLSGGSATSSGQYMGSASGLSSLLGPLRQSGARISVGSAGYLAVMKRWASCSGRSTGSCARFSPEAFVARSDYVDQRLSANGRAAAIAASRSATMLLDSYGGAINDVDSDATAFVHRDQLFSIQYLSYAADARSKVNAAYGRMRPYVSGQAYQNYMDPQLSGWKSAYYAGNWSRLSRIARKYDPDGVFSFKQGIDP